VPVFQIQNSTVTLLPVRHNGNPRGRGILAFSGYGIANFDEPAAWGTKHLLVYFPRVERIPFDTFRDLLPLYGEAVAADAKFVDRRTSLYWGDSAADTQRLKECKKQDEYTIASKKAGALIRGNGYMTGWRFSEMPGCLSGYALPPKPLGST
jgi:hypothetical protein